MAFLSGEEARAILAAYRRLGIQPTVDVASIKKAFRVAASKEHPDRFHTEAEKQRAHHRFIELAQARDLALRCVQSGLIADYLDHAGRPSPEAGASDYDSRSAQSQEPGGAYAGTADDSHARTWVASDYDSEEQARTAYEEEWSVFIADEHAYFRFWDSASATVSVLVQTFSVSLAVSLMLGVILSVAGSLITLALIALVLTVVFSVSIPLIGWIAGALIAWWGWSVCRDGWHGVVAVVDDAALKMLSTVARTGYPTISFLTAFVTSLGLVLLAYSFLQHVGAGFLANVSLILFVIMGVSLLWVWYRVGALLRELDRAFAKIRASASYGLVVASEAGQREESSWSASAGRHGGRASQSKGRSRIDWAPVRGKAQTIAGVIAVVAVVVAGIVFCGSDVDRGAEEPKPVTRPAERAPVSTPVPSEEVPSEEEPSEEELEFIALASAVMLTMQEASSAVDKSELYSIVYAVNTANACTSLLLGLDAPSGLSTAVEELAMFCRMMAAAWISMEGGSRASAQTGLEAAESHMNEGISQSQTYFSERGIEYRDWIDDNLVGQFSAQIVALAEEETARDFAAAQQAAEDGLQRMVGTWGYVSKDDPDVVHPALSISADGTWSEVGGMQYSGEVSIEGDRVVGYDWYLREAVYSFVLGSTVDGRECLVVFSPGWASQTEENKVKVLARYRGRADSDEG